MIERTLRREIERDLFHGKAIIVYGARQVGKTTLIQEIARQSGRRYLYLNCDEPDVREALSNRSSTELKRFIGDYALVLIDEAQRVNNIGLAIKLLVDNYPEIQLLVTGSSSFELSNKIVEPLTGRKREFYLYPFSYEELSRHYSAHELRRMLPELLIKGMYPDVVLNPSESDTILDEIGKSYLYKDILVFREIRKSDALDKLLKALALQVGNEVSYNELASVCGIDKKTVETYLQILEQAFIIYRLNPFSRNLRNELKKNRKIYFTDNGIRNILIRNLNPPDLRNDIGHLWENFSITERLKRNNNHQIRANHYFWRTHSGQELDLLEERGGRLFAFEMKWSEKKKWKIPHAFQTAYPDAEVRRIHRENYFEFVSV